MKKINTNSNGLKEKFFQNIKIRSIKDTGNENSWINIFKSLINNKIPDMIKYIQKDDKGAIQQYLCFSEYH